MPKVSVIVPVYNVENYIEKCVRSLFEQTLDDIEYIFVNDCTPDNSMQILERVLNEYLHRKPQVRIFNHEQNQGQAGARTTGMKAMTGEYMIHCDPDDWVEHGMYEIMYNKAIEDNADIVSCNIIIETSSSSIVIDKIYNDSDPKKSLQKCLYTPSLNDKIIQSKIIKENNIYPYENINFGEDLNIVLRALHFSSKHIHIKHALYHYNKYNSNSISNNLSGTQKFKKYIKPNVEKLCDFFYNTPNNYNILCNYIKYIGKSALIGKSKEYKMWCKIWPETHKYILKFPIPHKNKFAMYICSKHHVLLYLYISYLRWRSNH